MSEQSVFMIVHGLLMAGMIMIMRSMFSRIVMIVLMNIPFMIMGMFMFVFVIMTMGMFMKMGMSYIFMDVFMLMAVNVFVAMNVLMLVVAFHYTNVLLNKT